MSKFEVGKSYEAAETGYPPIEILKRTPKTISVRLENGSRWAMLIRVDKDGNEFAVDSSVPKKWRDFFTYSAKWECR